MSENIKEILIEDKKRNGCKLNFLILLSIPAIVLVLIATLSFANFYAVKLNPSTLVLLFSEFLLYSFLAKQNIFYKVCDIESKSALLKSRLEEFIEENSLTLFADENKAFGSLKEIIKSFLQVEINSPTRYFLFSLFLSAFSLFLTEIFIKLDENFSPNDLKSSLILLIYPSVLALWWLYLQFSQNGRIQEEILSIEEEYKERFWNESEIEKAKIIQEKILIKEIENSFKKAFTPQFIKDFEYKIKSRMELFFETLKSEKEFQNLMMEGYKNLLENYKKINRNQLEILTYIKHSKDHMEISYEKLQNSLSLLEETIDKLSKETQTLNIVSLNTFEKISNSIDDFEEKYRNIAKNTAEVYKVIEISSKVIHQRNILLEKQNQTFIKEMEALNINIENLNKTVEKLSKELAAQ